ncbi:MAG: hypothetical protein K2P63_16525 [Lachnospiraceae bacterium]|nr:hypothetical protein [Lachnospiraceae bacterium]
MKKTFMKRLAPLLVAAAVMGSSLAVSAAPETMPDGTIFDAEYYAQAYPDVAGAVGTDKDALYSHYAAFGKAEGRMACAPAREQTDTKPAVTKPATSIQAPNPLTSPTTPLQLLVLLEQKYGDGVGPELLTSSRPVSWGMRAGRISSPIEYDAYGYPIFVKGTDLSLCIVDAEGKLVGYDYGHGAPNAGGDVYTMIYDERGIVTGMEALHQICYSFVRDGLGRVTEIWGYDLIRPTERGVLVRITYDDQARTMIMWLDGEIEEDAFRVEFTFDEQGRLARYYRYEPSWFIGYTEYIYEYDASGRLEGYHGCYKNDSYRTDVEVPITFKYQYDK